MDAKTQSTLSKFLPIRVIVSVGSDGQVRGMAEHSFSMEWMSAHVCIFWTGKANSIIGQLNVNGIDWANQNHDKKKLNQFVLDPLAEDSPIEVDWETWLTATEKFDKRNAPFTVKLHGAWQLRAVAAEAELLLLKSKFVTLEERADEAMSKLDKIQLMLSDPDNEQLN